MSRNALRCDRTLCSLLWPLCFLPEKGNACNPWPKEDDMFLIDNTITHDVSHVFLTYVNSFIIACRAGRRVVEEVVPVGNGIDTVVQQTGPFPTDAVFCLVI